MNVENKFKAIITRKNSSNIMLPGTLSKQNLKRGVIKRQQQIGPYTIHKGEHVRIFLVMKQNATCKVNFMSQLTFIEATLCSP